MRITLARHCVLRSGILIIALSLAANSRAAESPNPLEAESQTLVDPSQGVSTGHNFVVAPIPISNPSIGTGLALTGMVLYKTDPQSPVSFTGVGGGYTSSHSWLAAVAEKLNFDADRYRLTAAIGNGQLNYDFFGIGDKTSSTPIPLEQKVFGVLIDIRRRIVPGLHLGLRYIYAQVKTAIPSSNSIVSEIDPSQLDLRIAGLGPVISWDTRDRPFAPRKGMFAEFKSNFAAAAFGSDLTYQTYDLSWNGYYSLRDRDVLAARVYLCNVSNSTPFFATCAYGAGKDLRGYEAGRFRDLNMIAGQVEYRRNLWRRFGAVAFTGAGSVAPTFGALFSSTLLPDIGLGLRYLAVPSQGVVVSVDYAWGKDGSNGAYVYIGDSF